VHDRFDLHPRGDSTAVESPSVDLSWLPAESLRVDSAVLKDHLYEHRDQQAVRQPSRVAASLDSMVVGEPQILGQVKEAFAVARTAGTVGAQLDHLLQSAFAAAKKVRSETESDPQRL
jgi:glutamyl-tRNA reductase